MSARATERRLDEHRLRPEPAAEPAGPAAADCPGRVGRRPGPMPAGRGVGGITR